MNFFVKWIVLWVGIVMMSMVLYVHREDDKR